MALMTDREKTAHLLRRFGFGASEAELDYYGQGGHAKAIDRLLAFEAVPKVLEDYDIANLRNANGNLNVRIVQAFTYLQALSTQRPLEWTLTLFWHDHFATSAQKVNNGYFMGQHMKVLRENAAGSFPALLEAVSKDPAMILWLDNQENVRGKPNENFAREVMELFTLGEGHYTEEDISEAARAFTGWTIRRVRANDQNPALRATYLFRAGQHDRGQKQVLGQTGPLRGEDVLGILTKEAQTARYITKKMWEWFAYPDPDDALIDRLASDWRQSGLEIKALVRSIAESPEFYSDQAERKLIKNPVKFCLAPLRQLGLSSVLAQRLKEAEGDRDRRRATNLGTVTARATRSMGMELLFPPDVAGWNIGEAWITSATIIERMKWSDQIFAGAGGNNAALQNLLRLLVVRDPSPSGVVDRLLELYDAEMLEPKRAQLMAAAEKAQSDAPNPGRAVTDMVHQTSRLIFGSPEFQFA